MKSNLILNYICNLHGYLIRTKEIHWATNKDNEHRLTDEILSELSELEDEFAEASFYNYGKIEIGDLKPYTPNSKDLLAMLEELEEETLDIKGKIKDNGSLTNILDDILTLCNKYKYRCTQLN